jgi:hypothetical protein
LLHVYQTAAKVCEFVLPSLNGLLAALETSSLEFQSRDFADLVSHSNPFLSSETSEHIRQAITVIKQDTTNSYAYRVLMQYADEGIVLSSNRVVLQVLTVKRNMIGCLIKAHLEKAHNKEKSPAPTAPTSTGFDEVWVSLLTTPVRVSAVGSVDLTKIMRTEYIMSLQFFADMRSFANELLAQGNVSYEFYYTEIMGISLQLASLASVYIHELDDVLPSHISTCLFNKVRDEEFWIHAAALDCSAFLGIK